MFLLWCVILAYIVTGGIISTIANEYKMKIDQEGYPLITLIISAILWPLVLCMAIYIHSSEDDNTSDK